MKIKLEWEKPDSLKNIVFPFDVWLELNNVSNGHKFQKIGNLYNLGFLAWRVIFVRFK